MSARSAANAAPSRPAPAPAGLDERLYPVLGAEQVARLMPEGRERRLAAGEAAWRAGDTDRAFQVVLQGSLAVGSGPDARTFVVLDAGRFSGDVDMLARRPSHTTGRAREATRLLEIDHERLRELLQRDVALGEILLRAFTLRRAMLVERGAGRVVLVGSARHAAALELEEFLTRNRVPYACLDVDRDAAVRELLEHLGVGDHELPVAICDGVEVLRAPTVEALAACLGLDRIDERAVFDLAVVGAGPAGLAAAVYAASEGLDVLVIEAYAPGGQAGTSSRIENFFGFPSGVSGNELAGPAFLQAGRFGASFAVARSAARLDCGRYPYAIRTATDAGVRARAVIVATGATYRRASAAGVARFEGAGVYHAATSLEARLCRDEDVVVVGGANSAGQAAVFLSDFARRVFLLVRGPSLSESMSHYLVRRVEERPNVEPWTSTEIESAAGDEHLERVTWFDRARDVRECVAARHVFMMTGATPNTEWLDGCVALDEKGFVKTGTDLSTDDLRAAEWPLARPVFPFETSVPRVFAVGDARASSTKRVAAAVGEGSACVLYVHRALAEERPARDYQID